MECIRRICCFKKQKAYDMYTPDDEEDFFPVRIVDSKDKDKEPVRTIDSSDKDKEPESFFRSSVLSIYKKVDSVYKQASEWSLPKKTHLNLFTLSAEDLEEYDDEEGFFDDVVDEKF